MANYLASILYGAQGERDNSLISLYKSVRAYETGPVALPDEVRNEAYRRFMAEGREDDARTLKLSPATQADPMPGSDGRDGEIILVGYAGRSPVLDDAVFWGTYVAGGMLIGYYRDPSGDTSLVTLPAPELPLSEEEKIEQGKKTKAGTTFHVKFSMPVVKPLACRTAGFEVSVDSGQQVWRSYVLANTEQLLRKDLQDNRNATLARTAVRVALRTIAAQKAKQKMESSSPLLNLLVDVGTDIAADQLERADTRLCFLLPSTIQMARIAVPPGRHNLTVVTRDNSGAAMERKAIAGVDVRPGEKKFVFVESLK